MFLWGLFLSFLSRLLFGVCCFPLFFLLSIFLSLCYMNLTVFRDLKNDSFSSGELSIDGVFQCWTLEDTDRGLTNSECHRKVWGKTAIPAGRYEVIINFSARFKKYMPLLLTVPCFEGIRIHAGNTVEQTDGCILVGKERSSGGTISQSRAAFNELMEILQEAEKREKIFLEVK